MARPVIIPANVHPNKFCALSLEKQDISRMTAQRKSDKVTKALVVGFVLFVSVITFVSVMTTKINFILNLVVLSNRVRIGEIYKMKLGSENHD